MSDYCFLDTALQFEQRVKRFSDGHERNTADLYILRQIARGVADQRPGWAGYHTVIAPWVQDEHGLHRRAAAYETCIYTEIRVTPRRIVIVVTPDGAGGVSYPLRPVRGLLYDVRTTLGVVVDGVLYISERRHVAPLAITLGSERV